MDAEKTRGERRVWIGLGSNVGPRERTLRHALDTLGALTRVTVRRVSPFIETPAVGGPPQPSYLNAAAELSTDLGPHDVLNVLQEVEQRFGRRRDIRWGPRTLDLDLLLYERQVIDEPDLIVPHPRMHERRFVLGPLASIAPQLVHPRLGRTVLRLLEELEARDG